MSKLKKVLLMCTAYVLVAALAIGGTLAYLTSTDSDVNVMTLGNVSIEQFEMQRAEDVPHKNAQDNPAKEGDLVPFEQNQKLYPAVPTGDRPYTAEPTDLFYWGYYTDGNGGNGLWDDAKLANVMDKFVFVKNTGKTDAYFRTVIAFECPEGMEVGDAGAGSDIGINANSGYTHVANNVYITIDGTRYNVRSYVYGAWNKGILKPGETARPSLLQVVMNHKLDNDDVVKFGDTYDILVLSQAVQAAGFDDAATALDTAFGELNNENAAEWFEGVVAEHSADTWDGTTDTSWYDENESIYIIKTAEQLSGLRDLVNAGNDFDGKTFVIDNDIDLNNFNWIPIGGIDASYEFKGEFDGNGHTISNLSLQLGEKGSDKVRAGLFASPTESYIHDFTLTGVEISGTGSDIRAGALAANIWTGTIVENVVVDDVKMNINGGSYLGGIAGRVYFAQMNNVDASNIEITNDNADGVYIGGYTSHAAGHTASGGAYNWVDTEGNRVVNSLFDDCDIDGVVINAKTEAKAAYIGGFVSSNQYNNSENFYENCNITGLDINCEGYSFVVGGFIGESYGQSTTAPNGKQYSFDGCSVQGTIDGTNGTYGGFIGIMLGRAKSYAGASADVDIVCTGTAGGFVGKTAHTHQNNATNTQKVSFTDCHATGDVTADIAGGFVGNVTIGSDASRRIEFTATDCSASGKANGSTYAGGFAGLIDGSRVSVADSYATFENCSVPAETDLYGDFIDNDTHPTTITVNK